MAIGDRFEKCKLEDGSHNGDPGCFTQWESEAGRHNGYAKAVDTLAIPSRVTP